jgi:hypothetical protein
MRYDREPGAVKTGIAAVWEDGPGDAAVELIPQAARRRRGPRYRRSLGLDKPFICENGREVGWYRVS